jgi:hypothetical protein
MWTSGPDAHPVLKTDLTELKHSERAWRGVHLFCLTDTDLLLETLFIAPCWCGGQGGWGTCPGHWCLTSFPHCCC